MLLTALKSIKEIGLSQVLSVGIVVQGLATQQIAHHRQESSGQLLNELVKEERAVSDSIVSQENFDSNYWQELNLSAELALSNESEKLAEEKIEDQELEDLYSPIDESALAKESSSVATSNLIALASYRLPSVRTNSVQLDRSPATRNQTPPANVSSNVNGVPLKEATPESSSETVSNPENERSSGTSQEKKKNPNYRQMAKDESGPGQEESVEPEDQQQQQEEAHEEEESQDEAEEAVALNTVNLFDDDDNFIGIINEGSSFTLDLEKEYYIVIQWDADFQRTVSYVLENLDTLERIEDRKDNNPPFAVFGHFGNNGYRDESFQQGSYQLDLEAIDRSLPGNPVVQERSLRFHVVASNNDDHNGDED